MKKYLVLLLFPICVYAGSPTIDQIEKAMQQGNIAQVEQMSKEAVKEHPKSAKAHYFLGQAYFNEKRMAEANTEFIAARKLDPKLSFTKKPEMFNDMLNRSTLQLVAVAASTPKTVTNKPPEKQSSESSLNTILLIIGTSLGLIIGILFLISWLKDLKKRQPTLGPEFELEDEESLQSTSLKVSSSGNVINKISSPNRIPTNVSRSYSKVVQEPQATSTPASTTIIKEREIVQGSNNDGLLTGIIVSSMLSHHGYDSGSNQGTTIINNVNNDCAYGSSSDFDNSSGTDWDSNDNNSSSFDTSPDTSSWDDSGGSSFDSSSSNDNW